MKFRLTKLYTYPFPYECAILNHNCRTESKGPYIYDVYSEGTLWVLEIRHVFAGYTVFN